MWPCKQNPIIPWRKRSPVRSGGISIWGSGVWERDCFTVWVCGASAETEKGLEAGGRKSIKSAFPHQKARLHCWNRLSWVSEKTRRSAAQMPTVVGMIWMGRFGSYGWKEHWNSLCSLWALACSINQRGTRITRLKFYLVMTIVTKVLIGGFRHRNNHFMHFIWIQTYCLYAYLYIHSVGIHMCELTDVKCLCIYACKQRCFLYVNMNTYRFLAYIQLFTDSSYVSCRCWMAMFTYVLITT